MKKKTISIEFTTEQFNQLQNLSSIRGTDVADTARDIVAVFLAQICAPIVNLPKTKVDE